MSFTWKSAGHAFSSLFKDVFMVSKKVEGALATVENEGPLVEALTALVSPQAATIEQLAFGALGELISGVHKVGEAASGNGINISFDASVVAEIKKLLLDFPQIVSEVEAVFANVPATPTP